MKYLTIKLKITDYYQDIPLALIWATCKGHSYSHDDIPSLLADYYLAGNGKNDHAESPIIEEY